MLSLSKILVPYDFSDFSRQALNNALILSRLLKAELHIIYVEVLHAAPLVETASSAERAEHLKKKIIEDNIERSALFKDLVIHYVVGHDFAPGPSILQYAEQFEIDLIVIGTHGRRGIRRAFLGSVAEEIVKRATCPVMTIRYGESTSSAFDKLSRILVPIDFSPHSEHALAHAKEIAALSGAQLDLLHVVPIPSYPTLNDAGVFSIVDYEPDIESRALKHLNSLDEQVSGPMVQTQYTILHGLASENIVHHAAEMNSDLIVIGTHGLTSIDRFFLGIVTAKTMRRVLCPVFIVRSFGKSLINPENEPNKTTITDTY